MSSDLPSRLRELVALRLFCLSAAFTSPPVARSAGAMPNTMPVSVVTARTKPSTRQSRSEAWSMGAGSRPFPQ